MAGKRGDRDGWVGRDLLIGDRARLGAFTRWATLRLVWKPLRYLFCSPLNLDVMAPMPDEPVVFVANHASHADTLVLVDVLARARPLAVAAADDYWFRDRTRGLALAGALGAFPFPREGIAGLRRTQTLLSHGWSVLIYPQGTRGGGPFRAGIGRLAAGGAVLVPVGVVGTREVLPKGSRWPRRHPVTVRVGEALRISVADEAVRQAAVAVAKLSEDPDLPTQ